MLRDVTIQHVNPDVPLPSDESASALPTVSARELQFKDFPPVRYVVPGYVVEGLTFLAGKPKLGKSWMALDWALAVALGGVAFGSVDCDQGDVFYAALEDNPRRLQRRIRQLLPPDTDWPERLRLCCETQLKGEELVAAIRHWAQYVDAARLIIIDTLAKVRSPSKGGESSYEADYAAIAPLQTIASELEIAIVIVHHVRKMDAEDPLDTVSGTTGLTGAADTVLVLARGSQGVTLYGRGRDIDEIETALSFDPQTGLWSILGDAEIVRRSDERKAIIDVLENNNESLGPKELAELTGQSQEAVRQTVRRMVKDGEITKVGHGKYACHNGHNVTTEGKAQ